MNKVENNIVHLLTGKHQLQEVSLEELQSITTQHPYFSVAQLLLTKKMKQLNHPDFEKQLQKTALYFPNIHWLHYQLMNEEEKDGKNINSQVKASMQKENTTEAAPVTEEEPQLTETISSPQNTLLENAALESNESINQLTEPASNEFISSSEKDEKEIVEENALPNQRLSQLLEEQAHLLKQPTAPEEKLPIETEPYHTIDYFASQGIKLEPSPQDKLTQKVHRFTDWLKQMKRIQPQPSDLGTDPEMEQMVAQIAAASNEQKDIITETMAEVLAKQGKADKAIQLYSKLSLLNPQKSAYFASKIEQLKGSQT
jgi:hypothetical protein